MAIKIAIANQKGGVAKTTTALCLADALIHCEYNVLLVDLDPQCNATSVYKAKTKDQFTTVDLLKTESSARECIQTTEMGDIIAGDPCLADITHELDSKINRYTLLKEKLVKIDGDYDFIIFDTPPGEGIYMLNALFAANGVIIPLTGEQFAVDGLAKIMDTIQNVKDHGHPNISIYGVLMTHYDGRKKLDRMTWRALPKKGQEIGFPVFKTPIRICQEIKNAQAAHESLFEYNPDCSASQDYLKTVKSMLEAE